MERAKCNRCGLVNWNGADKCDRCKSSLSVFDAKPEHDTLKSRPESSFGGLRIGIVVLIGLLGVFGTYQFFGTTSPARTVQTSDILQPAGQLNEMLDKVESKTQRRTAAELENMNRMAKLAKSATNLKLAADKKQTEVNTLKYEPKRIPPGTVGPAGKGVPYHTR